jgi:hypothetical protein
LAALPHRPQPGDQGAKGAQPRVLTLLRTAFDQPDADQVGAQVARVVEALDAKFPAAAGLPGTPAALVSCQ